jgi:hypothetical protein
VDDELCICGSSRPFRRCHGLRGSERRQRGRELHALGEVHDVAMLFPFVRPQGKAIEAFADRLAAGRAGAPRDCTPAEAAEGVRLLSANERRRIIRSWAGRYPERWRHVCAAVGAASPAEQALLSSAVRAAVADRIVCAPDLVADLEDGALESSPGAALALAISPVAVWSYEEVFGPHDPPVTRRHIARVRAQAARLSRRLPLDGLPRSSATLARGCELVAVAAVAAGVAELLLDGYEMMFQARADRIGRAN